MGSASPGAGRTGPPRRVDIAGVRLAVEAHGEGHPVLYIHGFPLNRGIWQGVVRRLPGWRHLIPDLRGFGESDTPGEGYSMARYAADVAGLLDAFGVATAVICGLSMGGYVAFEMMRRHGRRVGGLILVNTRAEPDTPEGQRGRDAMIDLVNRRGADVLADALVPKLLGPKTLHDRPEVAERLRQMIVTNPPGGIVGALEAMKAREDSRTLLSSIAVPALVIAGSEDALIPMDDAGSLARAIPGARLTLIPDAGHLTPMERPEDVARAIDEFLRTL